MRTANIGAANFNTHNQAARTNFKGLWDETSSYKYTQDLYGHEMICDYYEISYHPCADETDTEIKAALTHKQNQLKQLNEAEAQHFHGSYTTAVEGKPLPITKEELKQVMKDCKKVIKENMPQGVLKKLLKLK